MLKARTNHASTALNGEIYAIGGEAFLPVTIPLVPGATGPQPMSSLNATWESSLPLGISEPHVDSPQNPWLGHPG